METEQKQATLIKVDKNGIQRTKEGLQARADILNKFIELSERTLKTTFTDKQKIDLKDNGMAFVIEWITPKFKFPEADRKFNLQAIGINLTPIDSFWNANRNRWKAINVELDKGIFIIPDMDNLPEIKKHFYYAKNEKQEKAFKDAVEICKALNKFYAKGLIVHNKWHDIVLGFEFVRFGTESGGRKHNAEHKFYPNEVAILRI